MSDTAAPEVIDQQTLVVALRAAALLLELANTAYRYHPQGGSWSPETLRYEASYLEAHPEPEEEDTP